jgi:hypothetical protein
VKKMIAKKHECEYKVILAVCDKEHLGKTFEDGNVYFTASEKFYKGKEITEKELEEMLEEADSANLFGNKCVTIAEKKGIISEKSVKKINGIKHAQIYKV